MALAQRVVTSPRLHRAVALIGIGGACLFFGDGVITPAVSVLSAVEGLEVTIPQAQEVVIPISVVIIVLLFAVQSRGTGLVGRIFGPVMVVWFATIGVLGAIEIAHVPVVSAGHGAAARRAVLPAITAWAAFVALGAVVLAVTGAEALYADMGHFGAPAHSLGLAVLRAALPDPELLRPRAPWSSPTASPSKIRSSCLARNGCACPSCCSPPWPPSSPVRR